jgi:hypothetical protein
VAYLRKLGTQTFLMKHICPNAVKFFFFQHHAEVAARPQAEADALLDWCEEPFKTTGKPRSTREARPYRRRNSVATSPLIHASRFRPSAGGGALFATIDAAGAGLLLRARAGRLARSTVKGFIGFRICPRINAQAWGHQLCQIQQKIEQFRPVARVIY